MVTISDLRSAVSAYMNRDASTFVINSKDNLNRAINNAKNFCQRAVDFELARAWATVPNVDLVTGGNLDNAVRYGTTNPIVIKSIKQPFFQLQGNAGTLPVKLLGRQDWALRRERRYGSPLTLRTQEIPNVGPTEFGIVQYGKVIYVTPADKVLFGADTTQVYMDVIEWLPDFSSTLISGTQQGQAGPVTATLQDATQTFTTSVKVGDFVINTTTGAAASVLAVVSDSSLTLSTAIMHLNDTFTVSAGVQTSFLLDYAFDFLQFRSIYELNFFLKEDQRVPVSKAALDEVWNNVVQWNATIVGNSTDASLD